MKAKLGGYNTPTPFQYINEMEEEESVTEWMLSSGATIPQPLSHTFECKIGSGWGNIFVIYFGKWVHTFL